MKPYFDFLEKQMAVNGGLLTGFKMIRPEEPGDTADDGSDEKSTVETTGTATQESGADPHAVLDTDREEKADHQPQVLHWYLFPLSTKPDTKTTTNVVAWEATSHAGRATYFFRISPEAANSRAMDEAMKGNAVETAIQRLNRALVLLNFRREPIYLSDDALTAQLRYRHYAVACRNLEVLRELRASYIGRAIHTTLEEWQKQAEELLTRA